MACSSLQAIAASDRRHAAVFARAGAIPWLVELVRHYPHHACGGNAAAALRELLQDQDYHVSFGFVAASADTAAVPFKTPKKSCWACICREYLSYHIIKTDALSAR